MQDATLMFIDVGAGYRLYDNPCSDTVSSVSAIAELHYSTTVQDADVVIGNGLTVTSYTSRYDVLNFTLGVSMLCRRNISIRPAIVIPLRDNDDEHFDYEAMVQTNITF